MLQLGLDFILPRFQVPFRFGIRTLESLLDSGLAMTFPLLPAALVPLLGQLQIHRKFVLTPPRKRKHYFRKFKQADGRSSVNYNNK